MLPRQPTPVRTPSATGAKTSHLLTWLLAGCGLVVIATNLCVNIRITTDSGASASATQAWARRVAGWGELAPRAAPLPAAAATVGAQGDRGQGPAGRATPPQ